MRQRILVVLVFLILILGSSLAALGDDQGKVVGTWCSLCNKLIRAGDSCRHMRGSSSSGNGGGSEVSTYDPVAALHTEGHYLNEAGIKYYNEKNWAKAVEYFENAVRKWPENKILQKNLENAKDALRQEIAEKERQQKEIERQQKEAQTAEQMRVSINQFSYTLNARPPVESSGLNFESGKTDASSTSSGLEFMTAQPAPAPANLEFKAIKDSKALQEAEANLYNTKQGKAGAVFDKKGKKSPSTSLVITIPATGKPIQMSERARKDPRMIETLKELADLQVKRQKLDAERTKLAVERNSTKDPEKMNQLTRELDKKEKDFQSNLFAASNKFEKVEKLKRTIDTEVEKPSTSKQQTTEGTK
jgi:hypothetical protein